MLRPAHPHSRISILQAANYYPTHRRRNQEGAKGGGRPMKILTTGFGTKETCRRRRTMSADWGRADSTRTTHFGRFMTRSGPHMQSLLSLSQPRLGCRKDRRRALSAKYEDRDWGGCGSMTDRAIALPVTRPSDSLPMSCLCWVLLRTQRSAPH
jgi:hypothetical protein